MNKVKFYKYTNKSDFTGSTHSVGDISFIEDSKEIIVNNVSYGKLPLAGAGISISNEGVISCNWIPTRYYTGSTEPLPSLGNNGDLYLEIN